VIALPTPVPAGSKRPDGAPVYSVSMVRQRVTEDPSASARRARLESVDNWPMAILIHKTLGGKPKPVAVFGRDLVEGILLLRGACHTLRWCFGPDQLCGGPSFRELSGGNWMACGSP
jgi:hypothetical protein